MMRERVELSGAGERRRGEILRELQGRAVARRVGTRMLAGAGGAAVLGLVGVVAMVAMGRNGSMPRGPEVVHRPEPASGIVHSVRERQERVQVTRGADDLESRIRIVRNEPLPTRACGESGTGSGGVCVLDDAGLLRELARTGGSYGIIRVNGKVEVVSNREEGRGEGGS